MIDLFKTLTAMRWIALMNGRHDLAKAFERDMQFLEQSQAALHP